MLFNKDNKGGEELRELLGFIDASTNFDKWKTWLNLSIRQITALTGTEIYKKAEQHYHSDDYKKTDKEDLNLLVEKFQLTNALFSYLKMIPSLDAGHGNDGRKKMIGENEESLSALEQYKDEANIQNLAFEALEDLLNYLEEKKFEEWQNSPVYKTLDTLLIKNLTTFNNYFHLNSSRMFFTMIPMLKEIQDTKIISTLTATRLTQLFEAIKSTEPSDEQKKLLSLLPSIHRAMVLSSVALALRRLPVEIFPEGIFQTQIVGSIREKRIATKEYVRDMILSLEKDADAAFSLLQNELEKLDGENIQEHYIIPPSEKEGIKGFIM